MARLSLDLSPDVHRQLEQIAKENTITKAEAMRRAFALLVIAESEKKKNNYIGIVREGQDHKLEAIGRVVGI